MDSPTAGRNSARPIGRGLVVHAAAIALFAALADSGIRSPLTPVALAATTGLGSVEDPAKVAGEGRRTQRAPVQSAGPTQRPPAPPAPASATQRPPAPAGATQRPPAPADAIHAPPAPAGATQHPPAPADAIHAPPAPAGATQPRPAPGAPSVIAVGQVGGRTLGMAASGTFVYFGLGSRLAVADVSETAAPEVIGQTAPLGEIVRSVALWGRYALVAVGEAGIIMVDVVGPARPRVIQQLDTPGSALDVAVAGQRAYVADRAGGLRVLQLTDAAHLQELGHFDLPAEAHRVVVEGHYAYVVEAETNPPWVHETGIRVVDVSNPRAMRLVLGEEYLVRWAHTLAVRGDLAFVGYPGGVSILDVSDPLSTLVIGTLELHTTPVSLVVADNLLVMAAGRGHPENGWVGLVDVSSPETPKLVQGVDLSTRGAGALAIAGNRAYAALPEGGFQVVDVSDPPRAETAARLQAGFEPRAAVAQHGQLYVAAGSAGLVTLDISDPTRPIVTDRTLGMRDSPIEVYVDVALRVVGSGNETRGYALMTSQHGDDASTALRIFELGAPDGAVEVGLAIAGPNWWGPLAVTGNTAVVAQFNMWMTALLSDDLQLRATNRRHEASSGQLAGNVDELKFFDVSDVQEPLEVASMYAWGRVADVAAQDGLVFSAETDKGLRVIDVSEAADPQVVSEVAIDYEPTALALTEGYAFVAAKRRPGTPGRPDARPPGRVYVFDVSHPSAPNQVSSVDLLDAASGVAAEGDRAYVTFGLTDFFHSGPYGVYLLDISNPAAPKWLARREVPGPVHGVAIAAGRGYVTAGDGGLLIVEPAAAVYLPLAARP